jgi:3',5'-nucleoside bisphosphate phosphatase
MKADLHLHTQSSDGSDSASEILKEAKRLNLKMISITDHDSVGSVKEAKNIGDQENIKVISGVEFSVEHKTDMHIIGYFVDIENKAMNEKLEGLKEDRLKRVIRFIESLKLKNVEISLKDVQDCAYNGALSRAHIAEAIVKKGYVKDKDEAFFKYLNTESEAFVTKEKTSKEECIKLIHEAGGIAILAHPIYVYDEKFDYVLDELLSFGLNGMEAYHPDHSDEQAKMFEQIAIKKGMLITSGSDYHGLLKPEIKIGIENRTSEYLEYCIKLFYKKSIN